MKKYITQILTISIIVLACWGFWLEKDLQPNAKITVFEKVKNKPNMNLLKLTCVQIKAGKAGGAGVIIGNNKEYLYILTAKHIVLNKKKVDILIRNIDDKAVKVLNISNKNIFIDKRVDLALIRVKKPKGRFLNLSLARNPLIIGEEIYTIGHPVQCYYAVNRGIVSTYVDKRFLGIKAKYVLITAPSFNGNSGGAVVNKNTELSGIVVGIVYLGKKAGNFKNIYLPNMTFAVQLKDIYNFLYENKLTKEIINE